MEINSLKTNINIILNRVYPVGSIYISVNNVNPSKLFGGTWKRFGGSRYLIGVDPNNQDMNVPEKISGSWNYKIPNHTHTINSHSHTTSNKAAFTSGGPSNNTSGSTAITVNQMPAHQHKGYYSPKSLNAGSGNNGWFRDGGGSVSGGYTVTSTGGGQGHTHTLSSHTHSIPKHGHGNTGGATLTTNKNTELTLSVVPPYISCCMWKRIS